MKRARKEKKVYNIWTAVNNSIRFELFGIQIMKMVTITFKFSPSRTGGT